MTTYLLDTDTFIFLLKHQSGVEAKALAVGFNSLAVSVVTVAELLYGVYFSADPVQSAQMVRALLRQITIIDLDETAANRFGNLKAQLRRQDSLIADFDLLIAATAINAGRTLVTNNTRHFQRLAALGLVLEDWVV